MTRKKENKAFEHRDSLSWNIVINYFINYLTKHEVNSKVREYNGIWFDIYLNLIIKNANKSKETTLYCRIVVLAE